MDTTNNASRKNFDLRSKRSAEINQFERAVEVTGSQRAASKVTTISRSTAQDRIARRNERTLPLATQDFLDTVEGMMFLGTWKEKNIHYISQQKASALALLFR